MQRKIYELTNTHLENTFAISRLKTPILHLMKNMHQHSHYEICHLKYDSKSSVKHYAHINDKKYIVSHNSYILYPPNIKHKTERGRIPVDRLIINFRFEFVKPIADFLGININALFSHTVLNFSEKQLNELDMLTDKILLEYNKNINPAKNKYLQLLFANFLYILTQAEQKVQPENTEGVKINNVIDFITRNYAEDLTLDFLAGKFFISKFELCRKIKAVTGLNFSAYLTLLRINHSRELLEESRLTINEISVLVGYHTPAYFSSAFKKTVGVSPNEYRKNVNAKIV